MATLAKIKNIRGNSKTLLHFGGYNTIRQARNEFNGTDKQIYEYLRDQYNEQVDTHNEEVRRDKRNARARQKRFEKKNKPASRIATFFCSYKKASNMERNIKAGEKTFEKKL